VADDLYGITYIIVPVNVIGTCLERKRIWVLEIKRNNIIICWRRFNVLCSFLVGFYDLFQKKWSGRRSSRWGGGVLLFIVVIFITYPGIADSIVNGHTKCLITIILSPKIKMYLPVKKRYKISSIHGCKGSVFLSTWNFLINRWAILFTVRRCLQKSLSIIFIMLLI